MAIYETVLILDSLLAAKEIDVLVEQFSGIITANGGTIRKVDKWGKKRLAFEIRKKQYGFYVAIEFEGGGNIPLLLQSDYNYNDKVMRYLTYQYDKHQLQALKKAAELEAPLSVSTPDTPAEEVVEEKTPAVEETVVEDTKEEPAAEETKETEE